MFCLFKENPCGSLPGSGSRPRVWVDKSSWRGSCRGSVPGVRGLGDPGAHGGERPPLEMRPRPQPAPRPGSAVCAGLRLARGAPEGRSVAGVSCGLPQTFHFESRRSRLPPGRVFCSQEFHTAIREQSPFLVSSIYTAFHLGEKKKGGRGPEPAGRPQARGALGRRAQPVWSRPCHHPGPCPCPRLVGREECGLCNYLFAAQGQKAKVTIKMRRNPRIPRPRPGPAHSRQAARPLPR